MKASALALFLALTGLFSPLWAASPAHRVLSDVTYLAADRDEKLDLYLPAPRAGGGLTPAIVWVHGGGWTGGDKAGPRDKAIATVLAEAGYVVASINYRLGPGAWAQNMVDCGNAVRFLRARAAEYGIDPERIAIGGGSAGAHLALLAAFTARMSNFEPVGAGALYPGTRSTVSCVLNFYGPTNLLGREATDELGRPLGRRRPAANNMAAFGEPNSFRDPQYLNAASPVTYVKADSPPVLILHGTIDPEVDPGQPRLLAEVLGQYGVPHEVVFVEGAGHGFDLESWNGKPLSRDLRPVVLGFLARHLGPPARR